LGARTDRSLDFLTSAEAASLLGVSPSTVKRWVDDGTLVSERTAGGHRRIRRQAIHAFRERVGSRGTKGTVVDSAPRGDAAREDLLALLLSGRPARELEAQLIALRAGVASVGAFADALAPVLQEIGERWARGALSIADEHIASERLARALARLAEWAPVAPGAPVALLATASGDEHTLGLSLAELCLREAGWDARWIGRRTPTESLVDVITRARPRVKLVVLSASIVSSDAGNLAWQASSIGAACQSAGAMLLLGGEGAWPERPAHGQRVRSLVAFERALRKLEATRS